MNMIARQGEESSPFYEKTRGWFRIDGMKRTVVLLILDGWGVGRSDESNPLYVVNPERIRWMSENFPLGSLQASGINVGLPWGEIGNSEVGHLTLGAGKIIYQYYPKITLAIRDRSFFENPVLRGAMRHAKKNSGRVHLVGLASRGNVHASLDHLKALIEMAEKDDVPYVLHLFTDGKDSPPRTLDAFLKEIPLRAVASLIGRYYAMDREQNWYLTQKTYDILTGGGGTRVGIGEFQNVIEKTYREEGSEEFLPPLSLREDGYIKDGDALVFFNFREDSIREIAETFIVPTFDKFPVKKFKNLSLATMTRYRDDFAAPVAFPADVVGEPLGKVISDHGKTQLRLAETYKYAHVTYFFNGHREAPFKDEYRVLIPSQATIHADQHPEMMAEALTDRLIEAIQGQSFDFVLANYANPDTIGHTGNYEAALEAVRVIDRELGRILEGVLNTSAALVVTSDHGNIEEVINPMTGKMETQHDPNPVPLHLVAKEFMGKTFRGVRDLRESMGALSDVSPTVLSLMGLPKPVDMTGHDLTKEVLL